MFLHSLDFSHTACVFTHTHTHTHKDERVLAARHRHLRGKGGGVGWEFWSVILFWDMVWVKRLLWKDASVMMEGNKMGGLEGGEAQEKKVALGLTHGNIRD